MRHCYIINIALGVFYKRCDFVDNIQTGQKKLNKCGCKSVPLAVCGTYFGVGLNYVSMLATRIVLLLLKNMVFMQINILIVNMLNEFVRKMIEFGFITKKNANQSYFSMVKTTVNSNMQFSRSKMDKEGILRTVFECSNRLNEKSKANVMVYETMAATACGKKSISPALAASNGKETLAAELKEVLALFNGDSVSNVVKFFLHDIT